MNRREWIAGYLFLLPNFIGFLAFTGIPVIIGFIISLTDYTGFGKPNFIGFANYAKMFTDTDFKVALQNNLFYSLTSVCTFAGTDAEPENVRRQRFSDDLFFPESDFYGSGRLCMVADF